MTLDDVAAQLSRRWPETRIDPTLSRMVTLMELLGSPQHAYPSVHVAGTNGKTSVSRMIDALFARMQLWTGRIISPHLQSITERISIDNKPMTAQRYINTYAAIAPFVHMVDEGSRAAGDPPMSTFEVLTAMGLTAFAETVVDVAVVEVGLGGTWDATNVVDGQVAVITPIAVDHVEYLGTNIADIAGAKAGIIKAGSVAVLAEQDPAVSEVLLRRCGDVGATAATQGSEFAVLERRVAADGQHLRLRGLRAVYDDVFLPLHGEHQAHNAALALAAVEAFLGPDHPLDTGAVREAFATVTSPGRLERMRTAANVFVDAAHNPHGAAALATALTTEFDVKTLVGVVGVMADKDAAGFLAALEPVLGAVVITRNSSPRAMDVPALAALAVARFGAERVVVADNLADALVRSIAMTEDSVEPGGPVSRAAVIVTGSVVTAGEARTLLGHQPA